MLLTVANKLDAIGLRSAVAWAASLAYPAQRFFKDGDGNWVNQQAEGTIVSPTIHTASYAEIERTILDNWAWRYTPKNGDIIVDLGSGVGEEALVFSKMIAPDGVVVAVEAHPRTYQCLTQTIGRSGLENVKAVHCAVADTDGTARISNGEHISNSIFEDGEEIPQLSLDTLTRDWPVIDFLRCNIEGAERLAIQGAALNKVRHACISCHDFIGRKTKAEVRAALENAGFEVIGREEGPPWMRDNLYATRA